MRNTVTSPSAPPSESRFRSATRTASVDSAGSSGSRSSHESEVTTTACSPSSCHPDWPNAIQWWPGSKHLHPSGPFTPASECSNPSVAGRLASNAAYALGMVNTSRASRRDSRASATKTMLMAVAVPAWSCSVASITWSGAPDCAAEAESESFTRSTLRRRVRQ